eukprot:g3272.t1
MIKPASGARDDHIDVRVRIRAGLRGGKGGFGAQLKALGKAGAAKKTRNFGACRDLNGRRLRHVNDAIRLKLWRESRNMAEGAASAARSLPSLNEYSRQGRSDSSSDRSGTTPSDFAYRDGQTMSGISGWHLTTPSWADGVKTGKLLSQNKRKFYNAQRASDRDAEKDLQRKRARVDRVNAYASLSSEGDANNTGGADSVMSAVEAGLKREGQIKKKTSSSSSAGLTSSTAMGLIDPVLTCLRGSIGLGSAGEALGEGNFGSVGVAWAHLIKGCWFFEAELTSDGGVTQIGWATTHFLGDDANGDGVGDDKHSWGYDGHRGLKWHGGGELGDKERTFGGDQRTKEGDVLGCMFDFERKSISYWLNGQPLGVAFRLDTRIATSSRHIAVYPAASLEAGQSVRFNLGQRPFRFPPQVPLYVNESKQDMVVWTPVWESRPRFEDSNEQDLNSTRPVNKHEGVEMNSEIVASGSSTTVTASSGNSSSSSSAATTSSTTALLNTLSPELAELEALGMETLKAKLMQLGVKCGGTLRERAQRMLQVKGLSADQIPKSLRAKQRRKRKHKD